MSRSRSQHQHQHAPPHLIPLSPPSSSSSSSSSASTSTPSPTSPSTRLFPPVSPSRQHSPKSPTSTRPSTSHVTSPTSSSRPHTTSHISRQRSRIHLVMPTCTSPTTQRPITRHEIQKQPYPFLPNQPSSPSTTTSSPSQTHTPRAPPAYLLPYLHAQHHVQHTQQMQSQLLQRIHALEKTVEKSVKLQTTIIQQTHAHTHAQEQIQAQAIAQAQVQARGYAQVKIQTQPSWISPYQWTTYQQQIFQPPQQQQQPHHDIITYTHATPMMSHQPSMTSLSICPSRTMSTVPSRTTLIPSQQHDDIPSSPLLHPHLPCDHTDVATHIIYSQVISHPTSHPALRTSSYIPHSRLLSCGISTSQAHAMLSTFQHTQDDGMIPSSCQLSLTMLESGKPRYQLVITHISSHPHHQHALISWLASIYATSINHITSIISHVPCIITQHTWYRVQVEELIQRLHDVDSDGHMVATHVISSHHTSKMCALHIHLHGAIPTPSLVEWVRTALPSDPLALFKSHLHLHPHHHHDEIISSSSSIDTTPSLTRDASSSDIPMRDSTITEEDEDVDVDGDTTPMITITEDIEDVNRREQARIEAWSKEPETDADEVEHEDVDEIVEEEEEQPEITEIVEDPLIAQMALMREQERLERVRKEEEQEEKYMQEFLKQEAIREQHEREERIRTRALSEANITAQQRNTIREQLHTQRADEMRDLNRERQRKIYEMSVQEEEDGKKKKEEKKEMEIKVDAVAPIPSTPTTATTTLATPTQAIPRTISISSAQPTLVSQTRLEQHPDGIGISVATMDTDALRNMLLNQTSSISPTTTSTTPTSPPELKLGLITYEDAHLRDMMATAREHTRPMTQSDRAERQQITGGADDKDGNGNESYELLTGLPTSKFALLTTEERLVAAELKLEEMEMDDVYQRYLQPKREKKRRGSVEEEEKKRRLSVDVGNTSGEDEKKEEKSPSSKYTRKLSRRESREERRASRRRSRNFSASHSRAQSIQEVRQAAKTTDQMLYYLDLSVSCESLESPFLLVAPDPYLEILRRRQTIWERVVTSHVVHKSTNPKYENVIVNVDALCAMQLDRKITIQVWCNNKFHLQGRSLIGEIITSVSLIQKNIGARFPIMNPSKSTSTPSGFIRFHHAELCVIATRGALYYRSPNVADITHPSFERLTSCMIKLQIRGMNLPKRGLWKNKKPNTQIEICAWLPEGGWKQPPVYITDFQYDTVNPTWETMVLRLHDVCYGDINRVIQLRLRDHYGTILGVMDTTIRDLITHYQHHKKLYWITHTKPSTPMSLSSSSTNAPKQAAIVVRKATIFSRLLDLPRLASNAGIERRTLVVDSIRVDIRHALAQLEEDEKKVGRDGDDDADGDEKEKSEEAKTSDEKEVTKKDPAQMTETERISMVLKKLSAPNPYRGLHYLRRKALTMFAQSLERVHRPWRIQQQQAFLMGLHPRLGEASPIHTLQESPIFDRNLVRLIYTYM